MVNTPVSHTWAPGSIPGIVESGPFLVMPIQADDSVAKIVGGCLKRSPRLEKLSLFVFSCGRSNPLVRAPSDCVEGPRANVKQDEDVLEKFQS